MHAAKRSGKPLTRSRLETTGPTPKVALRYGPDRLQQCPRSRHTWLIPDTLTMAMGPATKRTSRC
jgi:hypothetical protein